MTTSSISSRSTPIRAVVLDMDGVLWHGNTPLPGLAELFGALRQRGLPFMLATNNATNTVAQYVQKLARFGVQVLPEQVLTSPTATAGYLQQHYPAGTPVYALGEAGLHEALSEAGFKIIGPDAVRAGQTAPLVVGGLTTTNLSYELLAMASLLVRGGAALVATNFDLTYPSEIGQLPGAGAVLSVVTAASGAAPTVIGKPFPAMFEEAVRRLGIHPAEALMVGDRLETDIYGAQAAGLKTALVLTGVSRRTDIDPTTAPDYVLDDLAALVTLLGEVTIQNEAA